MKFVGIIDFLTRILWRGKERREFREYPYLIEIRPILEKYKLKDLAREVFRGIRCGKFPKVPHVTLVYNFRIPKEKEFEVAKIMQKVISHYDLVKFYYKDIRLERADKGLVVAFDIEPTEELKELRRELYNALKPIIKSRKDVEKFNENDDFWFHSTIAYQIPEKEENFLKNTIEQNLKKEFYFPAHVLRVNLLKRGRIVFEYDIPSKKLLRRKEALSKKVYTQTLKKYREVFDMEVKSPTPRADRDIWLISDTHFDHENIIRYCARPFANVREMNDILLRNWNRLIAKSNRVYFLGDMSFGRRSRSSRFWLSRLNGEVRYISGNHEEEIWNKYNTISYNGYDFLLLHDPRDRKEFPDFDGWVIHGHVHNNDLRKYPFINWEEKTVNVCVEVINYKPLNLDKLVEILNSNLEENLETVLDFHELISRNNKN